MNKLGEDEIFREGRVCVEEIVDLLDKKNNTEAFRYLNEHMPPIQKTILCLSEVGYVTLEDLNEMMGYLVQSMENRDGVLLRDIMKYALGDVLNQLLPKGEA